MTSFIFLTFCSSMFFDEDGDLAHEFYEETIVTKNGKKKAKLRKIQKNLTPQVSSLYHLLFYTLHCQQGAWIKANIFIFLSMQGIIKLDHPCIHVDFPVVLCEVWLGLSTMSTPSSNSKHSWNPILTKIKWSIAILIIPFMWLGQHSTLRWA